MKPNDTSGAITAPLTVRPFAQADAGAWSSFVQGCADATFFHRIEWRDIIERVFGHRTHYLLAERGGEIAGVLPLAQVKSVLFGNARREDANDHPGNVRRGGGGVPAVALRAEYNFRVAGRHAGLPRGGIDDHAHHARRPRC